MAPPSSIFKIFLSSLGKGSYSRCLITSAVNQASLSFTFFGKVSPMVPPCRKGSPEMSWLDSPFVAYSLVVEPYSCSKLHLSQYPEVPYHQLAPYYSPLPEGLISGRKWALGHYSITLPGISCDPLVPFGTGTGC